MGKKERKERKEREEWMLRNGGMLLEKRISYFDGKYSNPMRSFSAEELQIATDNYNHENRITTGNFEGYKGCLEGRVIFVKKYVRGPFADPGSISNEISVAAQLSGHKNSLKLLGCCLETQFPIPVFEFPTNGNLMDQLKTNPSCLSWKSRLKIANEIASLITYLHYAFPRPIIHRDIKPGNFYLDHDLCAKLSDFIICMALPEGETQVEFNEVMGTFGYLAPEAMFMGVYSEKSDVFGFGQLLIGLLTSKSNVDVLFQPITNAFKDDIKEDSEMDCVESYIRNHGINEIVDPTILAEGGVHHHHQFRAILQLILECCRKNAEERPIMLDVAKQLRRIQRGDFIFDGAICNEASYSFLSSKMGKKERNECMLRNEGLLLEKRISYFDGKYSNPMHSFSAKELQIATNNYNHENRITTGNFEGYKGCLEGRVIFVKKYVRGRFADPGSISNEISVAAQLSSHKNSLKLLGCCLETQFPIPVFEFPTNGNLMDQLKTNPSCLSWKSRLKIANEIASLITYLHYAFPRPIIHRDIKPENFYLDHDLCAKLSDFIICMALPEGETQVEFNEVMGTFGYLAPEAMFMGVYLEKSDVFGFGQLLIGLLTSKSNVDVLFQPITNAFKDDIKEDSEMDCVESYIRNHGINEIVDPTILAKRGGVHHHHQFRAMLQLILKCCRKNAEERPIMLDVAKQLRRIQREDFISDGAICNEASS